MREGERVDEQNILPADCYFAVGEGGVDCYFAVGGVEGMSERDLW